MLIYKYKYVFMYVCMYMRICIYVYTYTYIHYECALMHITCIPRGVYWGGVGGALLGGPLRLFESPLHGRRCRILGNIGWQLAVVVHKVKPERVQAPQNGSKTS